MYHLSNIYSQFCLYTNFCAIPSPRDPPSSPLASAGVQAPENVVNARDRAVLLADSLLHRGTAASSKIMDLMISRLECIEPSWGNHAVLTSCRVEIRSQPQDWRYQRQ